MATVRMSHELRNNIMAMANMIFKKKTDAILERPFPPEWTADTIYETAIAPWKDHMYALPDGFMTRYNDFSINASGFVRTLRFAKPRAFPLKFPDTHSVTTSHSYMANVWKLPDVDGTPFKPLLDELVGWKRELDTIQSNKEAFVMGVAKVLQAHSTLAPALKAWPALWDLLPDETKERHKQVVSKGSSAKPELDDVDIATLTATVVMTKMGL